MKYFISNMPPDTSLETFAHIQGQRYWIEKTIRDANRELVLSGHECRLWTSMQHWLTLVLMGSVYLMRGGKPPKSRNR